MPPSCIFFNTSQKKLPLSFQIRKICAGQFTWFSPMSTMSSVTDCILFFALFPNKCLAHIYILQRTVYTFLHTNPIPALILQFPSDISRNISYKIYDQYKSKKTKHKNIYVCIYMSYIYKHTLS